MLTDYLLHLADNTLILGHRNSEWTGHGPVLEQDIALSNIALDLVGQSRNLYQLAANRLNAKHPERKVLSEDDLAYLRDASEFKNALLLEQPNGDWARTILRQFYFSQFQLLQCQALLNSSEPDLAAISEKSLKEVRYHLKWSGEWVCRLGDGTAESHSRMRNAQEALNSWLPELFIAADYEQDAAAVDPSRLNADWLRGVNEVLQTATLPLYREDQQAAISLSGKNGRHSVHLRDLLNEMQILQRTYPGVEW